MNFDLTHGRPWLTLGFLLLICYTWRMGASSDSDRRTIHTIDYMHLAAHVKRQYKATNNYLKQFDDLKYSQHSAAAGLEEELSQVLDQFKTDSDKTVQTSRKLINRVTPYFLQYSEQEAPIDSFVTQLSSDYPSVTNETLPLNKTQYDRLSRYSSEESSFTSTSAGLYFFTLRVTPVPNTRETVTANLYKNAQFVGSVSSDFGPVTNMFLVDLEPHDRVYVKVPNSLGIFGNGPRTQLTGVNI